MKALSVRGDFIMDMISGRKKVEYRTWKTNYRGPILMCSTTKKVAGAAPGYALCVMNLDHIIWSDFDQCYYWYISLKNVIEPIHVKGQLKLFSVDDDLIKPISHKEFDQKVKPLIYYSKRRKKLGEKLTNMKPITLISSFAQQAKFLPKDKIIGSKDFIVKSLSGDAIIPKDKETISPSEVGTIVDYLNRYVVLADEHAFDIANYKAREDLQRHVISIDQIEKLIDEEDKLTKMVTGLSDVKDLPDDAIILATDICAWEAAFRSGKYIAPKKHPDKLTINHIKIMIDRVEQFFEKYGWPTKDAFIAHTKNGCLKGDGDYLLKDTLVDLKVSNKSTMQMPWVRQLLLYYVLGFYNHVNDEKVSRLMIFNARANMVFNIDVEDIDKSVIRFVDETAEGYSKEVEAKIKQMLGI